MITKPTIEEIVNSLKEKFGASILSVEQQYDFTVLVIDKNTLVPIVKYLFDDDHFQFRFLTTLCGVHDPKMELPFTAMYQLHSLVHNNRIRLKAFLPKDNPEIDSLTSIFSGANWMERETFDFYGITFKGHPNLKRILNVDNMDYFPMRKEYPVEDNTRYDKDDTMFGREQAGFKKLN